MKKPRGEFRRHTAILNLMFTFLHLRFIIHITTVEFSIASWWHLEDNLHTRSVFIYLDLPFMVHSYDVTVIVYASSALCHTAACYFGTSFYHVGFMVT